MVIDTLKTYISQFVKDYDASSKHIDRLYQLFHDERQSDPDTYSFVTMKNSKLQMCSFQYKNYDSLTHFREAWGNTNAMSMFGRSGVRCNGINKCSGKRCEKVTSIGWCYYHHDEALQKYGKDFMVDYINICSNRDIQLDKCIELLDKKMNGSSYSDNDTQKCIYDLKMKLKVMNEQNEFLKNENTKLFYQNEYLRNAYYYCYNQNQYLYVENFQMKRCYSSLLENNSKLEEGNKRRRISDDESTTIK
jgi:hypothetical protein